MRFFHAPMSHNFLFSSIAFFNRHRHHNGTLALAIPLYFAVCWGYDYVRGVTYAAQYPAFLCRSRA